MISVSGHNYSSIALTGASIQNKIDMSIQRLSTGQRINAAKDDVAGLQISTLLNAEIKGLEQASRNAADAQSLLDTASAAIKEVKQKYFSPNWIGVIASCVSIEIAENSINELEILNLPFGYKVNLWGIDEPLPNRKINTAKFNEDAVNLNTIMGKRQVSAFKFLQLANKFIKSGATIFGLSLIHI